MRLCLLLMVDRRIVREGRSKSGTVNFVTDENVRMSGHQWLTIGRFCGSVWIVN